MKWRVVIPAAMLLLIAGGVGCSTGPGGQELIIATSTNYPPFSYVDAEGSLAGFDYQYGKLLCQRLEAKCEWRSNAFANILEQTARGDFDLAVNSHTRTAERERLVHFSEPYYYSFGQFVARAGSGAELEAGRVVAVQAETIYEKYLRTPAFSHLEVVVFDSQDAAFRAVSEGRADLTIADDVLTDLAILQSPFFGGAGLAEFEPVGDRIIPRPGSVEFETLGAGEIGIIVPRENAHLLPEINEAIREILAS